MITPGKDVALALRALARNPAFTALVVVTLGLGIGANTAIFSLLDGVLLKPLPFHDPGALVSVWERRAAVPRMTVSELDLDDYRARTHVFQDLAGFVAPGSRTVILTGAGDPAEIAPAYTTQNYFALLGVAPLIGRDFLPEEGLRGHNQVAILSYALWQSRFAGSPNVLQRQITVNQQKLRIIGVMGGVMGPQAYPAEADVFIPFTWVDPQRLARNFHELNVVGRLRPGQTVATAQQELEAIAADLGRSYPMTNAGIGVHVLPLSEEITGNVREPLLLLQLAVSLVLLIACGNAANLLLVRAAARRKEIAIRVALGASRIRIATGFAIECLLLSSAGASLGVLLAFLTMPLIRRLGAERIPRLQHVAIDGRVLLFTAGIALLTGLIFGLIPALKYSSANLNQILRAGGRTSKSDSGRLRNVLVAGEVALALVVAVGASLLVRSLSQLADVNPGFRADHVLVAHIQLPTNRYRQSDVESFYQRLLPRVAAIPGVTGVATATALPLAGPQIETRFAVQGSPLPEPGKYPVMLMTSVDSEFFKIMGIPILHGRAFQPREVGDFDHEKCIINQTFAKTYFSGRDPLGGIILTGVTHPTPEPCEIVGVAGDTPAARLGAPPQPSLYFASYVTRDNLLVRTSVDPLAIAGAVQRAVGATDPQQPLSNLQSLKQVVSRSLSRQAFAVVLLTLFSALGLILAALGLYGVVSYSVTQRTQEIGVRVALGAHPSAIFRLVLVEGLIVTGAGLVLGSAVAGSTTRLMSSLLFGIAPTDLLSFGVASASLILVSVLACFFPAYRATRIDPLVALRYE
jgi:predicted permease